MAASSEEKKGRKALDIDKKKKKEENTVRRGHVRETCGWVRIPWLFIARRKEKGRQLTGTGERAAMYLENCISETHQAVNHRKEKIYRFQRKKSKK